MNEKPNQRTMLTRRLLKDGLIRMLEKQSIYKISIRELCEEAGINRSTFYKYYHTQFDLLKDIENDMLCHVEEMLTQKDLTRMEILSGVCNYLENDLELCRLLINNNIDAEFPERLFKLPCIVTELSKTLSTLYGPEKLHYASCFLTYGCYHLMKEWINKENHEPPEEMAALLLRLISATA